MQMLASSQKLVRIAAVGLIMAGTVFIGFGAGMYGRPLVERFVEALGLQAVEPDGPNGFVPMTEGRESGRQSEMLRGLAEYHRIQLKVSDEESPTAGPSLPTKISEAPPRTSEPPSPIMQKRRRPPAAPNTPFAPNSHWEAPGYIAR